MLAIDGRSVVTFAMIAVTPFHKSVHKLWFLSAGKKTRSLVTYIVLCFHPTCCYSVLGSFLPPLFCFHTLDHLFLSCRNEKLARYFILWTFLNHSWAFPKWGAIHLPRGKVFHFTLMMKKVEVCYWEQWELTLWYIPSQRFWEEIYLVKVFIFHAFYYEMNNPP